MSNIVIAGKSPISIDLTAGEDYYWCRCGRSATQPLCDGAHKGTGIKPLVYTPTSDMTAHFCVCKHTKNPPFCDGSHADLK